MKVFFWEGRYGAYIYTYIYTFFKMATAPEVKDGCERDIFWAIGWAASKFDEKLLCVFLAIP